jgi:1,6-anhydro-N-acetylmuramate kinase
MNSTSRVVAIAWFLSDVEQFVDSHPLAAEDVTATHGNADHHVARRFLLAVAQAVQVLTADPRGVRQLERPDAIATHEASEARKPPRTLSLFAPNAAFLLAHHGALSTIVDIRMSTMV